jgi:A/G-specific adenine glycosylase
LSISKFNIFASKLKHWYLENHRDLPWRHTKDPYLIWLSEIILQQTRVAQGLPYYLKFSGAFPTVIDFANAAEDDILRYWQGLGYYSRARNMHSTAQFVKNELEGIFPNDYKTLLNLKGVGTYTAAAIASFSGNEHVAVLDGNVYRVLSRYFGVETDISSPAGKKEFTILANNLLPKIDSATHNQAIMEFGALQCTPAPTCDTCPLNIECYAFEKKLQKKLPVNLKKIKIVERYFYYFVFEKEGQYYMKKREQKGIWQGLFDFYLIEKAVDTNIDEILNEIATTSILSNANITLISEPIRHVLTHQRLNIYFILVQLGAEANNFYAENKSNFFNLEQIEQLPKPIIIANFIENLN